MLKTYEKLMKKCIALSKKSKGENIPNPFVGAIIYDEKKDEIISSGYHQKYGENHAERNAILNAKNSKKDIKDKTLIVNLEPCSHYGKTPPCADLIIQSGIKKVVVAMEDVNPIVKGNGIKKLREAGIEVIQDVLKKEAQNLNKIFIKNQLLNKPYVMTKIASTLDFKIALEKNKQILISNENSRNFVQKLRSEYQAIMTASGTVIADNPRLNVRLKNKKSPIRIILDSHNKLDFSYNVFKNDGVRIILVNNSDIKTPSHIEKIPFINYDELFKTLYKMGIYSVMVEAGCNLNSSLFKNKEIDEINWFLAPKVFNKGVNFLNDIDSQIQFKNVKIKQIEDDILINAKIKE